MSQASNLKTLQNTIRYQFRNIKYLEEALVHDSNRVNDRNTPTYQRLEFLGDSVLNLIVSDNLFRNHADMNEGQLSQKRKEFTEAKYQAQIAENLNLKEYIVFGQSVNKQQYSKYDKFVESIIGAVYVDGGFDEARKVVNHIWKFSNLSQTEAGGSYCVIS